MHHFNMPHTEADRRRQLQPPIHRPPPRVQGPAPPDTHQTAPEGQSASTPAVTVTRITQVEQHVPMPETTTGRSYTAAVKGGKRTSTNFPSSSMGSTGMPQPHPDNKRKNLTLLDPNYDPDRGQQQTLDSLQTPRPNYSPVTPSSVEEYLQPRSPGTPYFPVKDDVDDQQDNYNPASHLARLASKSFEASNNETAMDCAIQMLR